jgi:hypothetical protein
MGIVKLKLSEIKSEKKSEFRVNEKPELFNSLTYGFDYDKSIIVVTSDNYIVDGFHRHKIMCDIYGLDYEIYVKKIILNRFFYIKIVLFFMMIISPKKFFWVIKNGFK